MLEYVPTAPESFPTAIGRAGARQASAIAPQLERPQRDLGAERRGLGVDAVRATDHRGVALLARPRHDRDLELVDRLEQEIGRPHERDRQRGVDDVARREAVVDPGAVRRPDPLLDDVDERGDVVVGDPLALLDGCGVDARPLPDDGDRLGGDDAQLGLRLDGEQLDLEPGGVPGLVGEQLRHGCQ